MLSVGMLFWQINQACIQITVMILFIFVRDGVVALVSTGKKQICGHYRMYTAEIGARRAWKLVIALIICFNAVNFGFI
jgi:hypothetical protein